MERLSLQFIGHFLLLVLCLWGRVSGDDKAKLVRTYVRLRAGLGSRGSVWYHTGCIRNPLTGSEVVSIQGIETIKPLSNCSYLSSKVFVYTDRGNDTAPIDSFRVRRQAPKRHVNPVKLVHEIVTIGTRSQSNPRGEGRKANNAGPDEGKSGFYTQVEFASGRKIHSKKVDLYDSRRSSSSSSSSNGADGIGAGVGTGAFSGLAARSLKLVHYMNGASSRRARVVEAESASRPGQTRWSRWSRWVSFAGSDTAAYGKAQEYYHIWESSWQVLAGGSDADYISRGGSGAGGGGAGARLAPLGSAWLQGVQKAAQLVPLVGRGAALQCMRQGECPPWYALGSFRHSRFVKCWGKESRRPPLISGLV